MIQPASSGMNRKNRPFVGHDDRTEPGEDPSRRSAGTTRGLFVQENAGRSTKSRSEIRRTRGMPADASGRIKSPNCPDREGRTHKVATHLNARGRASNGGTRLHFGFRTEYNDAYRAIGDGVAVPAVRWLSEQLAYPFSETVRRILRQNDVRGSDHMTGGLICTKRAASPEQLKSRPSRETAIAIVTNQ